MSMLHAMRAGGSEEGMEPRRRSAASRSPSWTRRRSVWPGRAAAVGLTHTELDAAPLSGGALLRFSHLEAAAAARRTRSRWVVGGFGGAGKGKGWWVEAAASSKGEGREEAAAIVQVEFGSPRRGWISAGPPTGSEDR